MIAANPTSHVRVTSAARMTPIPFDFVWAPHVAIGKLTVVLDRTSTSTSALTPYITATAASGAKFPRCHCSRGATQSIVLASAKALKYSVRPQLDVFGADLTKVTFLHDVDGKLGVRNFSSAEQANRLKTAIFENLAELVAIEIPAKSIVSRAEGIFSRLEKLARGLDTAVVVIVPAQICDPKQANRIIKELTRMRAVGALGVVVRLQSSFVFRSRKSISGYDIPAISFRLEPATTSYDMPVVRISWDDRPVMEPVGDMSDVKPKSDPCVLDQNEEGSHKKKSPEPQKRTSKQSRRTQPSKMDEAVEFLQEVLANGPMSTRKLRDRREKAGIASITLRRAAKQLGLVKAGRRWRLP